MSGTGGESAASLLPRLLPGGGLEASASLLPPELCLRAACLYRVDAARRELVAHAHALAEGVHVPCPERLDLDESQHPLAVAGRRGASSVVGPGDWGSGLAALPLHHGDAVVGVLVLLPPEDAAADSLLHPLFGSLCAQLAASLVLTEAALEAKSAHGTLERTRRELATTRALLDSVVEGSDDGLILTDGRGRILRVNVAFAGFLGLSPRDLIGLGTTALHDLVTDRSAAGGEGDSIPWAKAVQAPGILGRLVLERPAERQLEVRASPLRDEEHRVSGTLFVARDITRHESTNRMKTEFVATVSHELRTPLTSLHGALRILESFEERGEQPEQGGHFLAMAVRNTERLIRLLDDILDVERIEHGRVELTPERFSAHDVLRDSIEDLRALADSKGVTLRWHAPPDAEVVGDRDRIQQVLVNLTSNAVKFSPRGETVSARARLVMQGIRFSVQDHGPGIPAEAHERIFERFQQGDSSSTRRAGGTGLGLAICKAIVEEHGGRIWLRSLEGQGSTFYFQIPLMRRAAGRSPQSLSGEGPTDGHDPGLGDR